jgi:hypothetical protein
MKTTKLNGNEINGTFTFNKENWSGEEVTVTVRDGQFTMSDYIYQLTNGEAMAYDFFSKSRNAQNTDPLGAYMMLQFDDGSSEGLHVDGEYAPEKMVKAAVIWIANNV